MNFVFAGTYTEAVHFIEDSGWLPKEVKIFSNDRATEGLRFVPGQDKVFVLPGTSDKVIDSIRRNAIIMGFDYIFHVESFVI